MFHETEQDYKLTLQRMRMKNNGICDYKGFEKVNPYEYKRKLNSKDMTDYKSLVTTLLVKRQNRLQLLQQNAAMYRENKRLQHLQNNRDRYLSNGWRNAEQPLHEQQ